MMMQTRIVAVSYLNTIPYIYGISHAGGNLREGLLLCPPSGCAEALRSGEANMGLIPVAAIPEIPGIRIVTPFCIGASGPVRTVVLAAERPVEELDTIRLDSHSRTSVRLARILAREKWGIAPQWLPLTDYTFAERGGAVAGLRAGAANAAVASSGFASGSSGATSGGNGEGAVFPDVPNVPREASRTGYILIGDKVFDNEGRFPYIYDLADEWRALTGLPFAFAAWVAREDVPDSDIARLEEALRYGTGHIREAIAWSEYAARPYAYDYLTRNIDFEFDPVKRRAMELYWQKGREADPPSQPG